MRRGELCAAMALLRKNREKTRRFARDPGGSGKKQQRSAAGNARHGKEQKKTIFQMEKNHFS